MIRKFSLVALMTSAIITSSPAGAINSWNGYHWARSSNPFALTINTALTKAVWVTAVGQAVTDWKKSTGGDPSGNPLALGATPTGTSTILTLTQFTPSGVSTKQCNPISGQILVCNDSYGQRGWLGIASIWLTNGHISQGTTKLNDTYFNMTQYNSNAWRSMVACQEIGHDFGLDHQDTAFGNTNLGSCMDYTNQPAGGGSYGPNNVHPNQHDYDELVTIYSQLDPPTLAATTNFGIREVGKAVATSPSTQSSGDSPAEWGRAIHSDAQGRPDIFERALGPGRKVLTHVLWAIGEGPR